MSPEDYANKAKELGISRGCFEPDKKFSPDLFAVVWTYQEPMGEGSRPVRGQHKTPPEFLIDLSWMNPTKPGFPAQKAAK